ncbi:Retrovirus-related Pol polyprotein from transposon RE1 [Bienertia sinuspersici]
MDLQRVSCFGLQGVWVWMGKGCGEELEALAVLPPLTEMNSEIVAYVQAQQDYQEEQKLFQLLSGLDETYSHQRSQILLLVKLPSLEEASNMILIQQEESQREIFQNNKEESTVLAMNTRKTELTCTNCGKAGHSTEKCWACKVCRKGHNAENCWNVKGFPPRYDKGKEGNKIYNPREKGGGDKEEGRRGTQKWSGTGSSSGITAQQLEKLIKMLPSLSKEEGQDIEDDLEGSYSRMVSCNLVNVTGKEWIVDSGASHHMTGNQEMMEGLTPLKHKSSINIPNGETSEVYGVGQVTLCSKLNLKNVMYIPSFKHNLLSIQKLNKDSNCKVIFLASHCIIQDQDTSEAKAIGKEKMGLYYLHNDKVEHMLQRLEEHALKNVKQIPIERGRTAMNAEMNLEIPGWVTYQGTE